MPPRLPRYLRDDLRGPKRPARRRSRQQRTPDDARRPVRKAQGFPRPSRQSRPPAVSFAPRRPERLGTERGNKFKRISWDEAISEIGAAGARLSPTYGSQAIMPYSYLGNMGLVQGINSGDPFFNRLGTTVNEKTFCASGSSTAWLLTHGPTGGVDPESFVHASTSSSGPAIRSRRTCIIGRSCSRHRSAAPRSSSSTLIAPARRRPPIGTSARSPAPMARLPWASSIRSSRKAWSIEDYVDNHTHGFPELKERAADFTLEYVEHVTGV